MTDQTMTPVTADALPAAIPAAKPRARASDGTTANGPPWTLLIAVIVTAPIFVVLGHYPSYGTWSYRPYFTVVDVMLVALTGTRLVPTLRGLAKDRSAATARALAALWVSLAIAFMIHPGAFGAATLVRLAAIITMTYMIGRANRQQLAVVTTTLVAATAFEAVVCLLQKITGHALGLAILGEFGSPFNPVGKHLAPTGTIFYPFPLAGLGLVTASIAIAAAVRGIVRTRVAVVGAMAGGVLVGLSFSVAGALSALALLACGVVALVVDRSVARRILAVGLLAFAIGLAGAGAMDPGGWVFKGERSTQGVEAAGNGRVGMLREAAAMVRRWPITGIGPGNFMPVRDAHPEIKALASEPQPVHMVPLLIVVEGGILAAAALLAYPDRLAGNSGRRQRGDG